jgi:pimeloyl-ACP methyl ester carboxylesterase
MTMPTEDFAALAAALPGETLVLDAYDAAVTAPAPVVRGWFRERAAWSKVRLVGHSAGGAAALEWLAAYPAEVECVVLLEPVDIDEKPSRLRADSPAHRAVSAALVAAGSWPWLARRIGRAGRRAFWRLFTKAPDHLSRADVDRIWGNRAALVAVWRQVFERFDQERRVRDWLADRERSRPAGRGPADPVDPGDDAQAFPPILLVVGDDLEPYLPELADRLGAELIRTKGDHLFPTRRPHATAALIATWHANTVCERRGAA